MGVYDRQIAQAQRVIKKKGQLVTWIKDTTVVSAQRWKTTAGAPLTFPVYIVFVSQGNSSLEAVAHLIAGTSVQVGAPKGLMGAVPFEPAVNDTVDRAGVKLKVESIDIVSPNGEVILHKIRFA